MISTLYGADVFFDNDLKLDLSSDDCTFEVLCIVFELLPEPFDIGPKNFDELLGSVTVRTFSDSFLWSCS